jgi:hypothetical protein
MYLRCALSTLALGAALSAVPPALADTFRCGQRLISEGMSIASIERHCGEPQSITRTQEPIVARRPNGTFYEIGIATREIWTYDRGVGKLPARLTIEEGIATTIELLSER